MSNTFFQGGNFRGDWRPPGYGPGDNRSLKVIQQLL